MDIKDESKVRQQLWLHGLVVLYLVKALLIVVYSNPAIQPFVYVRF